MKNSVRTLQEIIRAQFLTIMSIVVPNFPQIGGIFVFWIQNGHHRNPKWSQYGAACHTPCKYPFALKSFHIWIFSDFLNFYIGGHFEMVAILKIKKPPQFWVMIYFYIKFQKDPLFGVNLTFFAPWLLWQRRHFEFVQPLHSCHTLRWIFLQSFMKFDERNPNLF
jgi:hypothetical protein